MTVYKPRLGDTVEDTRTKKVGRVMDHVGTYVQVRPIGGGTEWDSRPEDLRLLTAAETLSAGITVANARSRGEQL
ncbi:hypothetical protein OK074_8038 [Actinobacteria bacterium OK074]|nr:hypothetical protein OK074_8038 [Actinobacteria bacterium OK074]